MTTNNNMNGCLQFITGIKFDCTAAMHDAHHLLMLI